MQQEGEVHEKILLRAGVSPLISYDQTEVIMRNRIGNNIGNLLFPASVCRALLCEDTVIDTVNTSWRYSSEHIRRINETYDCLVLPFANAFRYSFIKELTPDSPVSMNSRIQLPQKFHNFMYRSSKDLPNFHYVAQVIEEIRQMYMGMDYPAGFTKKFRNVFQWTLPIRCISPAGGLVLRIFRPGWNIFGARISLLAAGFMAILLPFWQEPLASLSPLMNGLKSWLPTITFHIC